VSLIIQAFAWIFDAAHWKTTAQLTGIPDALGQHLALTGLSLVLAMIIAVPLGFYIGHTGKGRSIAIIASNVSRAIPTLGLLSILILPLAGVIFIAPNYLAGIIVFAVLAIPPLLAGGYAGLESVDRQTVDAARAVGMTEWQILIKVEIPLGMRLIFGGLRSAILQIIATVTVGSLFGLISLGTYLTSGLAQNDDIQLLAGAILVAALALIADGLLAILQRFVVPRGVSRGTTKTRNTARGRGIAANTGTPIMEGN
jgi:osmoprotectant transport system permease protein